MLKVVVRFRGRAVRAITWFYLCMLMAVETLSQPMVYTNRIGMDFVLIKPGKMVVGEFRPPFPTPEDTIKGAGRALIMWMGDGRRYSAEEFARARELAKKDAQPGFEVFIPLPYYIGRLEVTRSQWKKVMGANPSVFNDTRVENADSHPVENVTWEDARAFIRRLNEVDRDHVYRLPTEFEWEYAARAGASGDVPWDEVRRMAHLGTKTTQPCGVREPNAWGLYDMLGNVWEWVEDFYNEKIFADPQPPAAGTQHVLKGASFVGDAKNATYMTHAAGPGNGWDVGFRVVMEVK